MLAYFVSITPLVVLGTDVLIGVLGALLQRRHVSPVFPMGVPKPPSVDSGSKQARTDGALVVSILVSVLYSVPFRASASLVLRQVPCSFWLVKGDILDRDLPPKL